MSNAFGIDLGSCNLKIYSRQDKKVKTIKNTIAVVSRDQMYAYGDEAYDMFEKSPEAIDVSFPVSGGVISSFDNMQTMLYEILENDYGASIRRSEIMLAIPHDITEVEKKAFPDLFTHAKNRPRRIRICDKPLAAALGAGADITSSTGAFVIDIGADTTEMSVISSGGIVLSEMLPFGGRRLDEAIISELRRTSQLLIGQKTAVQLKETLGKAGEEEDAPIKTQKIVGRNVVSGLPVTFEADSVLIREALKNDLSEFASAVKRMLEKIPPEVAKDVVSDGIYLTGGGSKLQGLAAFLEEAGGISVNVNENAETAVAVGLGRMLTEKRFAEIGDEIRLRMFR